MEPLTPPTAITGLVLCTAGKGRLAMAASEVTSIDTPGAEVPWVGECFGGQRRPTRWWRARPEGLVLWRQEQGVVVDSLQVYSDTAVMLPVPPALSRVMGGALAGFAEAAGSLWPVVAFDGLLRHLWEGRS